MEMRQFKLARRFVCIFMISISSIRGFLIFLGIMIFAFATSTNILEQNEFVHERLLNEAAPKPWIFNEAFYKKYPTYL